MRKISKFFKSKRKSKDEEGSGHDGGEEPEEGDQLATPKLSESKKKNSKSVKPPNPKKCSWCGIHMRVCICGNCSVCNCVTLSINSMKHCTYCRSPVCEGCIAPLISSSDAESKTYRCTLCAAPAAILAVHASACGERKASFHWGLYTLLSTSPAPRGCVNPACTQPLSFRTECPSCKVPTVPSSLFSAVLPHQDPLTPSVVAASTLSALERIHQEEQRDRVGSMSEEEVMDFLQRVFPSSPQWYHALCDPPQQIPPESPLTTSMVVACCTVAATVADAPAALTGSCLHMCDHPISTLLSLYRTNELYSIYNFPGSVRFVAFKNPNWSSMISRLGSGVSKKEVWSTADYESPTVMRSPSPSSSSFNVSGASKLLFQFDVLSSVADQLESELMKELIAELIAAREDGSEIVLCGHSWGGGLATFVMLSLLLNSLSSVMNRSGSLGVRCVTFGSPAIVAGEQLLTYVESAGWNASFHHCVYRTDLMSRFYLRETYLKPVESSSQFTMTGVVADAVDWLDAQQPLLFSGVRGDVADTHASSSSSKHSRKKSSHHDRQRSDAVWWSSGDILMELREPSHTSQYASSSEEAHAAASLALFGCFHCFYLHPSQPYTFITDREEIRCELSSMSASPRLFISDSLMRSYTASIAGYLNSLNSTSESA